MSVTATLTPTLGLALEQANPNSIADALRLVNLSKMVEPQKLEFSVVVPVLTVPLDPPALLVQSVRVTLEGTAALGRRVVSDSGDTASATVCLLSDDGASLTFEGTVKDVTVVYMARSEASLSSQFPVL